MLKNNAGCVYWDGVETNSELSKNNFHSCFSCERLSLVCLFAGFDLVSNNLLMASNWILGCWLEMFRNSCCLRSFSWDYLTQFFLSPIILILWYFIFHDPSFSFYLYLWPLVVLSETDVLRWTILFYSNPFHCIIPSPWVAPTPVTSF